MLRALFFICICLQFSCSSADSNIVHPRLSKGSIDIRGWDFHKNGPIQLNGDWLFAWNQKLKPDSWQNLQNLFKSTAIVPSSWPKLFDENKQPIPQTGYASYAIRILHQKNAPISIFANRIEYAAEVFVLDRTGAIKQKLVKGEFSAQTDKGRPGSPQPLLLSLNPPQSLYTEDEKTVESILLIHISNYFHPRAGMMATPEINLTEELQKGVNTTNLWDSLLLGIFIIIGLYHLILYIQRSDSKTSLYFGLLSLSIAMRIFALNAAHAIGLGDSTIRWSWILRFEYLSMPFMALTMGLFLESLLPSPLLRRFVILWAGFFSLPLIALVLFSMPLVFADYVQIFQGQILVGLLVFLIYLILLSLKRVRLARYLLLAFIIVAGGVINDILYNNQVIETAFIAPQSVITFILIQAAIISGENARDFKTAKHLSSKLEEEVKEQTLKLARIQNLSQEIQQTSDYESFWANLKIVLKIDFQIKNFALLVYNPEHNALQFRDVSTAIPLGLNVLQQLNKVRIPLYHANSLHGAIFIKNKSFYAGRVKNKDITPEESYLIDAVGMSSVFIIPLKMDEASYGIFSIFDSSRDNLNTCRNLSKKDQRSIELLSQYISTGLYQTIQKEALEVSQAELQAKTAQLERIHYLSQQVQNTSDREKMIPNLQSVLNLEFQIDTFALYLYDASEELLKLEGIFSSEPVSHNLQKKMLSTTIKSTSKQSMLGKLMLRNKSSYFRKLPRQSQILRSEQEIIELMNLNSLYLVPLEINQSVFALLCFGDWKGSSQIRVNKLTKTERNDIALLSQYISSSLFQAIQQDQIDQARLEVARAQNEATVNQLAAHLAHEVNNPLNFISSGKTIVTESHEKFKNDVFDVLSSDEETQSFKTSLLRVHDKFERGNKLIDEGQTRIDQVIAEIRAITGVDGLNYTTFSIQDIVDQELSVCLERNNLAEKDLHIEKNGFENDVAVLSSREIIARSIRTVISHAIYFASKHQGKNASIFLNIQAQHQQALIDVGNNSNSIKNIDLNTLFDIRSTKAYGTEQIGLAMVRELLRKVNANLILLDDGKASDQVLFQIQIPIQT